MIFAINTTRPIHVLQRTGSQFEIGIAIRVPHRSGGIRNQTNRLANRINRDLIRAWRK
jgi:hypothetical protein